MLDLTVTLFGLLVVGSVSTLIHSSVNYLSTAKTDRSLAYILESLLLFIWIVDSTAEAVTGYEHYMLPVKQYRPVIYFEVLLFLIYAGCLLSIKPNQETFNIQIPLLQDDNRKRSAFWIFFALASLLEFLWSILVSGFSLMLLILLSFPLLAVGGAAVEISNSIRASTVYTAVVTGLVIVSIVFKRIWDVYAG